MDAIMLAQSEVKLSLSKIESNNIWNKKDLNGLSYILLLK